MLCACGPLDPQPREAQPAAVTQPDELPPIIATERGKQSGRLVFLAQTGERLTDLTESGSVPVRDNSPSWSPDGRWVVFASSRGRDSLLRTSLWIVRAEPGAPPRRLTLGEPDDRDPAWSSDGKAVVFASDRGGTFDLWRLSVTTGRYGWPVAAGQPEQLTQGTRHELHPSPAPDGQRIVYTDVDLDSGRSALWLWSQGTTRRLTEGPADATPAWSPDGRQIAFAAQVLRDQGLPDADLFVIDADGQNRRLIVDEPLAMQTEPVWSADGRFLFSTSLYRSVDTGKPVLSSVTFVDLEERPPVLRTLQDPAVIESRTGAALANRPLDPDVLRRNPTYQEALKRAVEQQLIRNESGARPEPAP